MATHSNRPTGLIWPLVTGATVLALVIVVLMQRAAQRDNKRLQQENEAIRSELAAKHSPVPMPKAVLNPPPPTAESSASPSSPLHSDAVPGSQDASAVKQAEHMVITPTGMAPAPRASGLVLAGAHAVPMEGGLKSTIRFKATTRDPMGIVAIVVRLPRDGEARVLEFGPTATGLFSSVTSVISEDGRLAMYHGTAAELESIEFALSVSAPVAADMRGTCGVGPLELRIGPDGAFAKSL